MWCLELVSIIINFKRCNLKRLLRILPMKHLSDQFSHIHGILKLNLSNLRDLTCPITKRLILRDGILKLGPFNRSRLKEMTLKLWPVNNRLILSVRKLKRRPHDWSILKEITLKLWPVNNRLILWVRKIKRRPHDWSILWTLISTFLQIGISNYNTRSIIKSRCGAMTFRNVN